jgi:hypothetical protein
MAAPFHTTAIRLRYRKSPPRKFLLSILPVFMDGRGGGGRTGCIELKAYGYEIKPPATTLLTTYP